MARHGNNDEHEEGCSFCGRRHEEVKKLIAGPNVFICDECVGLCNEIVQEGKIQGGNAPEVLIEAVPHSEPNLLKPKEIKACLDEYVIGQEHAKRVLSVAVHNHYKRIRNRLGIQPGDTPDDRQGAPLGGETPEADQPKVVALDDKLTDTLHHEPADNLVADQVDDAKRDDEQAAKPDDTPAIDAVELQKSNIILIGPTGSGKTLLAQTLARILNVPFGMADATTLTEAGYVGEDVENILVNLYQAAGYDLKRAERGIVYIDEIDKIAKKSDSASLTRDVSGEGVQQALLKIIEGTVASIPPKGGRKHPQQEYVRIDTSNILFICGGAFVGLDGVVKKRLGSKSMGFGAKVVGESKKKMGEILAMVQPEDLLRFGLIPEFVGRLPVIATMNELDEADLIRILREPKNALTKQYEKLFEYDNVRLRFTEGALTAIAQEAVKRKSGARGLRSVMEEAMLEVMYELPSQDNVRECVISEQVILNGDYPVILYEQEQKSA